MGESDPNSQTVIVRVCQRIKMENDKMNNATPNNGGGSRRQSLDSEIGNGHENRPKDIVSEGNCIESILKNAPDLATGGVDTAENEPS